MSGGLKVFYGLDDIKEKKEVIVVEGDSEIARVALCETCVGEMDKLALEMAGYTNVVSVPNGAPGKVKKGPINPDDKNFRSTA